LQRALAPFITALPPAAVGATRRRIPRTVLLTTAGLLVVALAFLIRGCWPTTTGGGRWDQELQYRLEATLDSVGHDIAYTSPQGSPQISLTTRLELLQELHIADRASANADGSFAFERSFERLRQRARVRGVVGIDGQDTNIDETRNLVGQLEGQAFRGDVSSIDELSLRPEALLPDHVPEVGESWNVAAERLAAFLAPVDIVPPPASMTSADAVRGTYRQGPEQWFTPATQGTVTAGVTGIRTVSGRRLADIALEFDLGDRVDLLAADSALVAPDQTVQLGQLGVSARFRGSGTLVWALDEGRFVSLVCDGELSLDMAVGGSVQDASGTAQVTRSSQYLGPMKLSITAE